VIGKPKAFTTEDTKDHKGKQRREEKNLPQIKTDKRGLKTNILNYYLRLAVLRASAVRFIFLEDATKKVDRHLELPVNEQALSSACE
jgi:hypothetical protein